RTADIRVTIMRLKELARIKRAIESHQEAELLWAGEYCRSRIQIAPTEGHRRYWRALLRKVEPLEPRAASDAYRCGLRPGDRVRLKKALVIRGSKRYPTKTHLEGEVWTVLPGSSYVQDDVWL